MSRGACGQPRRRTVGRPAADVPDVPLVDGQADPLAAPARRSDAVGDAHEPVEERVELGRYGEEAGGVAVVLLDVEVSGEQVDLVVGLLQHRGLPGAEGGHRRAGAATDDEGQVLGSSRCALPQGAGRLRGEPAVVAGRLVPGLPRSVHLVAEAPPADVVRLGATVLGPQVGEVRATGMRGVLLEVEGLLDPSGAEVDGQHRLHAREVRPAHELVQPEPVGLRAAPREVAADGTSVGRPDAVLHR